MEWVDWEFSTPKEFCLEEKISRVQLNEASGSKDIGYLYDCRPLGRPLFEYMLDAEKLDLLELPEQKRVFEAWRTKICKLLRKMENLYNGQGFAATTRATKSNIKEVTDLGYNHNIFDTTYTNKYRRK